MRAVIHGDSQAVFGIRERKPLKGFPEGRVKIRLRNTDFARAFVKTASGIRQFIVAEVDGFWTPKFEQGSNEREAIP